MALSKMQFRGGRSSGPREADKFLAPPPSVRVGPIVTVVVLARSGLGRELGCIGLDEGADLID
jgi:hypothetical protein